MKRLHILIAILFTATISMAQTLQEAADAYSKENYSASVKMYETLSDSVGVSAELYYNLGNSYYKLKNYPKAVLNYERALLLSPGDEDIKFNLEMAKANVVIPQNSGMAMRLKELWQNWKNGYNALRS